MSRSFMRIRPQWNEYYCNVTTRQGVFVHASTDRENADCGYTFGRTKKKWFTRDDINCDKCISKREKTDGQHVESPDL